MFLCLTCLGPVAVVTLPARLAMVAKVVMGVVRDALETITAPPVDEVTLPVPVTRLDTPETHTQVRSAQGGVEVTLESADQSPLLTCGSLDNQSGEFGAGSSR